MAVQKRKKSRSRRDMRRSHDHLTKDTPFSVDFLSGEEHRRHHATESGYYRGRKVFEPPQTSSEKESEE